MDDDRRVRRRAERIASRDASLTIVDGSTFQKQLESLAITLTNLLEREGVKTLGHGTLSIDIAMIMRQLTQAYDLLLFLNADETRDENLGYRQGYSFVVLPIVRTIIDGFYNITALLEEPKRILSFRASGYFRVQESLKDNEQRYGTDPRWAVYLTQQRHILSMRMRQDGTKPEDVADRKNKWPLLGSYLAEKPQSTPHKEMLRRLTHGFWQEYSSISHATYSGLLDIFPFISRDLLKREDRERIDDFADRMITAHIGRAAGILAAACTEIQAKYQFKGHNVNARLHQVWRALNVMVEVKDIYDFRYAQLMLDEQLADVPSDPL